MQYCPVFDGESRRGKVPFERAGCANVGFLRDTQFSLQMAEHNEISG